MHHQIQNRMFSNINLLGKVGDVVPLYSMILFTVSPIPNIKIYCNLHNKAKPNEKIFHINIIRQKIRQDGWMQE